MKRLFCNYLLTIATLLVQCVPAFAQCKLPEQISSKAIFSEQCAVALFTSNRDGIQRPYTLSLAHIEQGNVAQLLPATLPGEYVAQDLASNCADVALVKDNDGDQRFAVFLFNRNSQELKRISLGNLPDAGLPSFSPNGKFLAYASSQNAYIYDLDAKKEIHQFSLNYHITSLSWSPSNQELFLKDHTGKIFEYSLINKRSTQLWKISKATYAQPLLTATSDFLYFISDHQSDFSQIYRLDRKSHAVTQLQSEAKDQFDPTPFETQLMYRSSEANRYCLRSNNTAAYIPDTCDGVVFNFKPQKDSFWLVYANYSSPMSLYHLQKDKPKRELLGIKVPQTLTAPQSIPSISSSVPHLLFMPAQNSDSLVVWLHGGPHENISPRYNPFIANILAAGHAVLALNYPGSTGAGNQFELRGMNSAKMLEVQLNDIKETLTLFLKQHSQFRSIHLLGVSYGGGLAHKTFENFTFFSSIIDFSGKSEFSAETISALQLPGKKPALFIFGTNDTIAANESRTQLFRKYQEHTNARFVELAKEGHVIRSKDNNQIACDAILQFLSQQPPK